jgi:hypothetical protein
MRASWKEYLSEENNTRFFVGTCCFLLIVLFSFLNVLSYNETRTGYVFNDPVMGLIEARDLSFFTFILTYSFAIAGLLIAIKKPPLICALVGSYAILTGIRMLCLYIFPLDPPPGIIPLSDVFLKFSFYSGRQNLRDLFFSGHTATLFLFVFVLNGKKIRIYFSAGACVVGMLLVIQHVHYSIDVIAAPFFAYMSVLLHQGLTKKLRNSQKLIKS